MSAVVKPSTEGDAAAFAISVLLHVGLLAVPLLLSMYGHVAPAKLAELPNSIAMVGNSIEVEAPTPEVAAAPAAPQPEPVDIATLPTEPTAAPKTATEPELESAPKPVHRPTAKPRPLPRAASIAP